MAISDTKRREVWNRYCGASSSATDVFGRNMSISTFEVDHIWAESIGGSDNIANLIPLSSLSNQEKSNDTAGIVNGRKFRVVKASRATNGIGILYVEDEIVTLY